MLPSHTIFTKNLPQTTQQAPSPLHPKAQNQLKTPTLNLTPVHSPQQSASRCSLQNPANINLHSFHSLSHTWLPHLRQKPPISHTKNQLTLWTPSVATCQTCPILASRTATRSHQLTATSRFPFLQKYSQRPHPTTHLHSHSYPTLKFLHS